jgi:hypothetical protein
MSIATEQQAAPSLSPLLKRMMSASASGNSDGNGNGVFKASATKVNATLPIGVPLAGYNHGHRRVKNWPLPQPTK